MTTWVLEKNVFAEVCFDEMVAHFQQEGIPYRLVTIIPFSHEIDGKTPQLEGPVVCYGSIGVHKLAQRLGWRPGVWTGEAFSEQSANAALPHLMLNPEPWLVPMKTAKGFVSGLVAGGRPKDAPFFIKPNTDTKEFAGTVVTPEEFGKWHDNMVSSGYLDTTDFDVVISPVRDLGVEWRVVVVDGKVSSASIYRQYRMVKPERHILPEVEALVLEAHRRYAPAPVYVIDVAQVRNGSYEDYDLKIVEYNSFNTAGLYACDVRKIIDDVNAYVERTHGD